MRGCEGEGGRVSGVWVVKILELRYLSLLEGKVGGLEGLLDVCLRDMSCDWRVIAPHGEIL